MPLYCREFVAKVVVIQNKICQRRDGHHMHKFVDKIKADLLYMGLGRENLMQVKALIDESNRRDLMAWSIFVSAYMLISLLLSLRSAAFESCRLVYIITLLICVVTGMYAAFFGRRHTDLLPAMIGLFSLTTLGMGLGIGFCQPDTRTVTAVAISIIIPTCFIVPTPTVAIWQILSIGTFVAVGHNLLAPDPYSFGLLALILFSVMGTMIGHIVNKSRFERFFYADSAEKLVKLQKKYAYYDSMTGIQNRRAYSERLQEISEDIPDDLHIIMIDVNGLKDINDRHGHKAGDELLIGTAECLVASFGRAEVLYRIGGDEFCAIVSAPTDKVAANLTKLDEITHCWNGQYVHGISLSYGVGTTDDGHDLETIVRKADKRMYESKRRYYESSGIDRRRHN